jgi:hypothetical protein
MNKYLIFIIFFLTEFSKPCDARIGLDVWTGGSLSIPLYNYPGISFGGKVQIDRLNSKVGPCLSMSYDMLKGRTIKNGGYTDVRDDKHNFSTRLGFSSNFSNITIGGMELSFDIEPDADKLVGLYFSIGKRIFIAERKYMFFAAMPAIRYYITEAADNETLSLLLKVNFGFGTYKSM